MFLLLIFEYISDESTLELWGFALFLLIENLFQPPRVLGDWNIIIILLIGKFHGIHGKFRRIHGKFRRIHGKFNRIHGKFHGIHGKFHGVNGKFYLINY